MTDIFFVCLMKSTRYRYMEIKLKIDMVFSPRLSYLKTDFGWVRNRGGLGPGTSQTVTSKKEPKVYIFCELNKYKRQTLGKCSSTPTKRLLGGSSGINTKLCSNVEFFNYKHA